MEDLLACCCGVDIHKASIVACLVKGPANRELEPQRQIREFGTQFTGLNALRSWLEQHACHAVAMESAGIYWQPVYAVLESGLPDDMHLLVVDPRHMKNVPGKQTGLRGAERVATLLRSWFPKRQFCAAARHSRLTPAHPLSQSLDRR